MKILYILKSSNVFGGASKSFITLLHGVLAAGHKATVVVPDEGTIGELLRQMNVQVWVVPSREDVWTNHRTWQQKLLFIPRQLGRIFINWQAEKLLFSLASVQHFDLVHSNNSTTLLGYKVARKLNIPHIFHIREYGDLDFGLTYFPTTASMHRKLCKADTYSICITRDIQAHHGLASHPQSQVIYNGIIEATNTKPTTAIVTERDILLYAGRVEPTKGLLELVKAYNDYVVKEVHPLPLWIAGEFIDSSYTEQVRQYADEHQLSAHITFLGRVGDMPSLYRRARATIVPSKSEGFGRIIPEAMGYGSIVIGHDTAGLKEQLDNGLKFSNTEIGLRYHDKKQLVAHLQYVQNATAGQLLSMQQAAYHTVTTLYSEQNHVKQVTDFYQRICKK